MRKTIALCLTLAPAAWGFGAVFSSPELGLTFQHPDNWQVTTKKGDTRIVIPLPEGGTAQLSIFPRAFNSDIVTWNAVEKDIAKQQSQTVDSQTQEEIMGVPLLLTRVRYTDNGRAMESLSGLVYSATPRKLLFLLRAPEGDFDKAEEAWRAAMTTLRTLDGKLPTIENPDRKVTPEEAKAGSGPPMHVTTITQDKPKRVSLHKGPVVVQASAAGRKLILRLPSGWSSEKRDDGSVMLRHADLSSPLKVLVLSSLDGDEGRVALDKASAASLAAYSGVRKREDPTPAANAAGAMVATVWRWGADAVGNVEGCDAVGISGDFYWTFSYRGSLPMPATKDVKLLQELVKTMSVELAP